MHPETEFLSGDDDEGDSALHVGRIVPVYEAAGKVNTRVLRTLVHRVLQQMPELEDRLPEPIRDAPEISFAHRSDPRGALPVGRNADSHPERFSVPPRNSG